MPCNVSCFQKKYARPLIENKDSSGGAKRIMRKRLTGSNGTHSEQIKGKEE